MYIGGHDRAHGLDYDVIIWGSKLKQSNIVDTKTAAKYQVAFSCFYCK